MHVRRSFIKYFGILIVAALLLAVVPVGKVMAQTPITVCAGGSCDYETIQAAIGAANPGDTINVGAGTYEEDLNMPEPVNLIGTVMPVIQGELNIDHTGYSGSETMQIEGIRFETLSGTKHDSIVLKNVNGITVKGCQFDGGDKFMADGARAVQMSNPNSNVTIEDSTFENGYYVTIAGYATGLTVKNSTIANVKSGINLQGGGNLVVEDTNIAVVAQGAGNDTYGIRFASPSGTAENMNVHGGSISVDKNSFDAEAGTYHSAIVIRSAASGTLSVDRMATGGEVVNLSSTLLDASPNWWGSTTGPAVGTVVGDVKVNPWCYNEACTELFVADGGLIQDAIDAANDGDTILVGPGTYAEKLELRTPNITVQSTDSADVTILDVPDEAEGVKNTGVTVLGNMGTVIFDGFTVKDFTETGIAQGMSAHEGTVLHAFNNIVMPKADYLRNGIQVSGDGSTVIGNTIQSAPLTEDWTGSGIMVVNASNVTVENNTIKNGDNGITVLNYSGVVNNITVKNNTVEESHLGLALYGKDGFRALNAITVENNTFTNDAYISGSLGINIQTTDISDLTVKDNLIENVSYGFRVSDTSAEIVGPVTLRRNQFVYNYYPVTYIGDVFAIDAEKNWWDSVAGPADTGFGSIYLGSTGLVDYDPWCGDAECSFTVSADATGSGDHYFNEEDQLVLSGTINIPGGFTINEEGLTILLADDAVIENDSPCFTINASNTKITAATLGTAKCVPTSGSNGIDVAAGLTNIIIEGFEIDGADGTNGIHYAGAVTDTIVRDMTIHGLAGDGIYFAAQPAGTVDIQGNLFMNNGGVGVNNTNGTSVDATYNAWGTYADPTAAVVGANVTYDPWTHVDLYLESTNPDVDNWLNQVFVDETITYEVKANLVNAMGADFVLKYPAEVSVESKTLGTVFDNYEFLTAPVGEIRFKGDQFGSGAISGEDLVLFTVTFSADSAGKGLILNLDETTDEFSMAPGTGPSLNIYAAELADITSLDVITRPTLTALGLEGPHVAGLRHEFSTTITNLDSGGVWMQSVGSPQAPDAMAWIRITDITEAGIHSLQFVYGGVWYDLDDQPGQVFFQDGDDLLVRFGNQDYGFDIGAPSEEIDQFAVTFLNSGTHDVTFEIYDMMNSAADRTDDILLTSIGPVTITVAGDFDVTGTVSMQGRSVRSGVPLYLTAQSLPEYGPFDTTSIGQISDNVLFTGVNGGVFEVTTLQPRYLNVTADLDKQISVAADYVLPALELKGGNADWSNDVIDLSDAGIVGGFYGTGTIADDGDVNFDNRVNIQDLALVGGNFDLTSAVAYVGWTP